MIDEIDKLVLRKAKVISLKYGLGEIVSKFSMYDGVDDYLEVLYQSDMKSRYFCVKHFNDVRLLSSRASIDKALASLNHREEIYNMDFIFNEFSSTFFQKDVIFIVQRINDLLRREELNDSNNSLLLSSVESLVQEIVVVYSINYQQARSVVEQSLRCA